jgi:hypothetical protein
VSPDAKPTRWPQTIFRILLTVIAVSAGLLTLLSLVLDSAPLRALRGLFVEWTVIVLAFALLLGAANVLRVHARRIHEQKGTLYSLILIVAFLAVFVPGIMPTGSGPTELAPYLGPTGAAVEFAVRYVQRPLQATFFSLLAFLAATAMWRTFRKRSVASLVMFLAFWRTFRKRSVASLVMFLACLLVLLGSIRLDVGEWWQLVIETKDWIMNVPVLAGARGILLGIALGGLVAGARLLLGVDRPYSGRPND